MAGDYTQEHLQSLVGRIRELCPPMVPQPTGVRERLTRLDGVRAVLFDVYGTLFVSGSGDIGVAQATSNAPTLEEALLCAGFSLREKSAAASRGEELFIREIQRTHAKRRHDGIEYPEVDIVEVWQGVLSALIKEGLVRGDPCSDAVTRLAVEYECRVNPVWPMPDLADTLKGLLDKGLVLGIVSNAQFFTPLLFRAFLDSPPEDVGFQRSLCVWSYRIFEAKPSTALFQRALATLESESALSPHQTLYVGNDKLNDIWPAAAVGCRTALFAGDKRSLRSREDDPRCAGIEPDAVITHLRQLPSVIVQSS